MKFEAISIEQSPGKILAHNISDQEGIRRLRKGRIISEADVDVLRVLGLERVYAVELEDGDVHEDDAAWQIAEGIRGAEVRISGGSTGRANLLAESPGVFKVDPGRVAEINRLPGVTVSTLRNHAVVPTKQLLASVKIITYALPEGVVRQALEIARRSAPVISLAALQARKVGLILSGAAGMQSRLKDDFEPPLRSRIEGWGSSLHAMDFVPLGDPGDKSGLVERIQSHIADGCALIILAGETAIMDDNDIVPRAIRSAGGVVESLGAPVDPGNLLMLAYFGEIPVLGAPGCARSRGENVVDWLIPRLLTGERVSREDIIQLGHGGLLEDVKERPVPREPESGGSSAGSHS
jgi:molybdenum cofactor cytidylyltransferase